jgi:hypothetical protein
VQFFCSVPLRLIYIGVVFTMILLAAATRDSHYFLALATLGDATEIGSFLFMWCCPRRPRQVQECCCHLLLSSALSHHLCQCKHCLREVAWHASVNFFVIVQRTSLFSYVHGCQSSLVLSLRHHFSL